MVDQSARIDGLLRASEDLRREIGKVIVGQGRVVDEMLVGLFAGGHVLLEGVPGLAKTLLIGTLAQVLDLSFSRIQFTPDLMPGDITGSEILEEDKLAGRRSFRFVPGPVFANLVLADEINRTPPKTQAALLQAMQEHRVTAGGLTHDLPAPFFVLATQNPIEQEGTYPLPEAQLDRFLLNILIGYPERDEEIAIVEATTGAVPATPARVLDAAGVLDARAVVHAAPAARNVVRYAVALARATRPDTPEAAAVAREFLAWGAGPRAGQALLLGAKARALLAGRPTAALEDVRALAHPVLRHRLVANFHAEAEGVAKDRIIDRLLDEVPA
ncbi:MAG: MoxR family ATPase [bacterium]|nr:MoxR family ATPase [bacterium]MBK9302327.1 MoxR family ATPase [bacterium]